MHTKYGKHEHARAPTQHQTHTKITKGSSFQRKAYCTSVYWRAAAKSDRALRQDRHVVPPLDDVGDHVESLGRATRCFLGRHRVGRVAEDGRQEALVILHTDVGKLDVSPGNVDARRDLLAGAALAVARVAGGVGGVLAHRDVGP
jgi:hypothetical protein